MMSISVNLLFGIVFEPTPGDQLWNLTAQIGIMTNTIDGDVTRITASDIGSTGYTITTPGKYALIEDVDYATIGLSPAITIDANDVHLDLNNLTINASMAHASGTDIIRITSGKTNVTVEHGTLKSTAANPVCGIDVAASCEQLYFNDLHAIDIPAIETSTSCKDISIFNVRITNNTSPFDAIYFDTDCSELIIDAVDITNGHIYAANGSSNVFISNCTLVNGNVTINGSDIVIEQCTTTSGGIVLANNPNPLLNAIVKNCTSIGGLNGILINTSEDNNCVIQNCIAIDCTISGIGILSTISENCTIEDCTIRNCERGIFILPTTAKNIAIARCTISGSTVAGISANSASDVRIVDCQVSENPGGGIEISFCSCCDVIDTVISKNGQYGLYTTDGGKHYFGFNTFLFNDTVNYSEVDGPNLLLGNVAYIGTGNTNYATDNTDLTGMLATIDPSAPNTAPTSHWVNIDAKS